MLAKLVRSLKRKEGSKVQQRAKIERGEKERSGRGKSGIAARLCRLVSAQNKTKSPKGPNGFFVNVGVSVRPFTLESVMFHKCPGVVASLGRGVQQL